MVKEVVKKRLDEFKNNHKDAFKDLSNNPIWMNKEKGVFIKSVRCFTGLSDLQPLHKNQKGENIDFVSTGNNHHIAIYKDEEGKLRENIVTFWNALERKKAKLPIVINNPKEIWNKVLANDSNYNQDLKDALPLDKWTFITSLQQNEMFVFGLTNEELINAVHKCDYALISKNLFRVQKIANSDYVFRHHLETKLDDSELSKSIMKFKRVRSLSKMNGIKIKINTLGKITNFEK